MTPIAVFRVGIVCVRSFLIILDIGCAGVNVDRGNPLQSELFSANRNLDRTVVREWGIFPSGPDILLI